MKESQLAVLEVNIIVGSHETRIAGGGATGEGWCGDAGGNDVTQKEGGGDTLFPGYAAF